MKICSYNYFLRKKFKNWDPNQYDWEKESWHLTEYCREYFKIWWDSERYNWYRSSYFLSARFPQYFKIWWDFDKYNWKNHKDGLYRYCFKYKSIWEVDYIAWRLKQ